VAPEVSALDFAAGLSIQGSLIPGLITRRMQTEIELESGQSFAIGGLLDRRLTETVQKVPLLSSIPLLGQLFQSKSLNKQNNELLVIVTPEIVRPIPQGKPLPHLQYPEALPGSEAVLRTPGLGVTGQVPLTPQTPSIPLEQLLESLKVQGAMKLDANITTLPAASAVPSLDAAKDAPKAAPAPPQNPPK
jgi:pilus assembly protein CpaC